MIDDQAVVKGRLEVLSRLDSVTPKGGPVVAAIIERQGDISASMREAMQALRLVRTDPWSSPVEIAEFKNRHLEAVIDCAAISKQFASSGLPLEQIVRVHLERALEKTIIHGFLARAERALDANLGDPGVDTKLLLAGRAGSIEVEWPKLARELCTFLSRSLEPVALRMAQRFIAAESAGDSSIDPYLYFDALGTTAQAAEMPHVDNTIERATLVMSIDSQQGAEGTAVLLPGSYKVCRNPVPDQPSIIRFLALAALSSANTVRAGEGDVAVLKGSGFSPYGPGMTVAEAHAMLRAAQADPILAGRLNMAVHVSGTAADDSAHDHREVFRLTQKRQPKFWGGHPHAL